MSYPTTWQTAVTFEFWDTMNLYHRTDYGFFDWLSDIGGLYNILSLIFFILLSLYISNGPSLFVATEMISKVFMRSGRVKSNSMQNVSDPYKH